MARNEAPPFGRGETFYNGSTIDSGDLQGVNLEGKEWVFEDINPTTGVQRSAKYVRCRVVRNTAAIALLPKRVVSFEADGLEYGCRVDGYSTTTAAEGFPLDEFLPTAGLAINDLGWIVIEGPATVLTDIAAAAGNVVSVGGWVVALTGATSGATTSGHVAAQVLTGATALLAAQVQNRIGRALSAKTTANTNADILIDVGKW
jgi:hypothetical protein